MRQASNYSSHILEFIEINSAGRGTGAHVPPEWVIEADRTLIEGTTTIGSDGRRLTPLGRRQLWALNVSRIAALKALREGGATNFGSGPRYRTIWWLLRHGLVEQSQSQSGEITTRLTALGKACVEPPNAPPTTHIIRIEYGDQLGRHSRLISFAGDDTAAERQMIALLSAACPDLHRRPMLAVRRINERQPFSRISRREAQEYLDARH